MKNNMINYVCPKCGMGGAHPEHADAPLCHACDYKVEMKPVTTRNLESDVLQTCTQDIDGKPARMPDNYLDPVTYVPAHANGNAGHSACEQGVIINITTTTVFVLFCNGRTVQSVQSTDLVWG